MGCNVSILTRNFVVNEKIPGQDHAALTIMLDLGLSMRDIDALYTAFLNMDTDYSNTIQATEFFKYFELESNTLERKLFCLFLEDTGKSSVINFMQFTCLLWNILTLDETNMGCLAFMLADPTAARMLSYTDIKDMFECIHKKKIERDPALRGMLIQLKRDLDSAIKVKEFTAWTNENSSILTPLRILQTHLRIKIVGTSFWEKKTKERRDHEERGSLEFIIQLRKRIITETKAFLNKLENEYQDEMRIGSRGKTFNSDLGLNNTSNRKKSILVDYFNLKLPNSSENKIFPEDSLTQQNSEISPKYRQRSLTSRNSNDNNSKSPVRRREGTIASFSSINSNISSSGQSSKASGKRSRSHKYEDAIAIATSNVHFEKRQ